MSTTAKVAGFSAGKTMDLTELTDLYSTHALQMESLNTPFELQNPTSLISMYSPIQSNRKSLDPIDFFHRSLQIAQRFGYPRTALLFLISKDAFLYIRDRGESGFDMVHQQYWGVNYEVLNENRMSFDMVLKLRLADYIRGMDIGELEDAPPPPKPVYIKL